MAGAGFKTWTAGEVVTAAGLNTYIQQQAVMVFASAAARTSALGTAVSEGMVSYRTDSNALEFYDGAAWVAAGQDTTLTNVNIVGQTKEAHVTSGTGFAGYTFNVVDDAVQFITANSTANGTVNIRGNGSTTLNSFMAVGDTITIVLVITNGATAYYPTAYQIDGSAITPLWAGGTAPTAGNANSRDVYTLTIFKTASATYTTFAAQVRYA